MPTFIVDGMTYPMPEKLTFRELGVIKRFSGFTGERLEQALDDQDTDVIVALLAIAMRRAGAKVDEDKLLDMTPDEVEVRDDEPEAEANGGPPALAAEAEPAPAPKRRK